MRKLILASLVAVTSGCASHQEALQQASGESRELVQLSTPAFIVQATVPRQVGGDVLRVFVEGDGRAWITSSSPSLDPTPTSLMVAKIAAADSRQAVYLARPCQFVESPGCDIPVWTSDRFSESVIVSMSSALDQLKARYGVSSFELVGYSGGGAVALLLAARRNDVSAVQTLAGNISPKYWAASRELSPLSGSLDPTQFADRLRAIPQRHFVGRNDKVVPRAVAEHYQDILGEGSCSEVQMVDATHHEGLQAAWSRFGNSPLRCADQLTSSPGEQ
jgi:pimeloyl-ACP methyl ester carboxylesterase